MSYQPLRFVHAADCRLDSPLREIGPLPEEFVEPVACATLTAFERVVSACIAREADFLLLTGRIFDDGAPSLAAGVAVVEECARLETAGIDVLVWTEDGESRSAWETIPDLPANVRLLPGGERRAAMDLASGASGSAGGPAESLEIAREGRPVVEVRRCAAESSEQPGYEFRAAGDRNGSPSGLVIRPCATQGLSAHETGPHGCTLIEAESDGAVRSTFLPTAAVRRERFALAVDDDTRRGDLLERMCEEFRRTASPPSPQDGPWLCTWRIEGSGSLFDRLSEERFQRQLIEALIEEFAVSPLSPREGEGGWSRSGAEIRLPSPDPSMNGTRVPPVHHEFHPIPAACGDSLPSDLLARDFFERLDEAVQKVGGQPAADLAEVPPEWGRGPQDLDRQAIAGHARRLGRTWFAAAAKEEPAA